jgi:hypothetical protein
MKRKSVLLGICLITLVLIIPIASSLAKPKWFIQYQLTTQTVEVTEDPDGRMYYELTSEGVAMGPNIIAGTANAEAWGEILETHSTMEVWLWIYDKDGSYMKFYDVGTFDRRNPGIQVFRDVTCTVVEATGKFEEFLGNTYMKEGWISAEIHVHGKLYGPITE